MLDETAHLIAEFARDVLSGSLRFSQALAQQRGIQHVRLLGISAAAAPAAGCVVKGDPLGPGVIQTAIDHKTRKLTRYRGFDADEYWLLIVGGLPVSGFVTVDDAMSGRFVSPFHKTVFLDRGTQCVYLETDPPDANP